MPRDDEKKVSCSFCYKTQDQVDKLIAGPNVYICNECIDLCCSIIESEPSYKKRRSADLATLPKPVEIKAKLDEYVIGQDAAKIALSVAVYNHYKRIESKGIS
ncbi:MAG: ATP-dependent Clp protease ATP-binding subunit ClpX, partial [Clostridia bacterium]|nr:ATP-dependent Clp protease ATP-binding subunit ClpX [Clostridia bacterium]